MERFHRIVTGIKIVVIDLIQNVVASSYICPIKLRILLLNFMGNKINKSCYFSPGGFLGWGKGKLLIDEGTFVNYKVFFDLGADIIIGKNVNIAMNVRFINSTHEIGDKNRRAGIQIAKPIKVGNGVWLGADSVIMPGVSIGEGTIIGAGSLVLNDCEPNALYVGRPAQLKKYLEDV